MKLQLNKFDLFCMEIDLRAILKLDFENSIYFELDWEPSI